MIVEIEWTCLDHDEDERWDSDLCLYAYLHPERDKLLYVGKADYATVRERLRGADKERLFADIQDEYDVDEVRVLRGEIRLDECRRRSSELLADIESLLIIRLQPFGNIQSTQTRIQRPGLRVTCTGDWPLARSRFRDR